MDVEGRIRLPEGILNTSAIQDFGEKGLGYRTESLQDFGIYDKLLDDILDRLSNNQGLTNDQISKASYYYGCNEDDLYKALRPNLTNKLNIILAGFKPTNIENNYRYNAWVDLSIDDILSNSGYTLKQEDMTKYM